MVVRVGDLSYLRHEERGKIPVVGKQVTLSVCEACCISLALSEAW